MPPGPRSPPAAAAAAPWRPRDAWTPQSHPGWTSSSRVSINPTNRPSAAIVDGGPAIRGPSATPRSTLSGRAPRAEGLPGGVIPRRTHVLEGWARSSGRCGVCRRSALARPRSFGQRWICGAASTRYSNTCGPTDRRFAADRPIHSISQITHGRLQPLSMHEVGRGSLRGAAVAIRTVRLRRIGSGSRRFGGGRSRPDGWRDCRLRLARHEVRRGIGDKEERGLLDARDCTMSERVLRARLAARRRPAGADLPLPALPDEAADGAGGGGRLGMDGDHQADAPRRVAAAASGRRARGPVGRARSGRPRGRSKPVRSGSGPRLADGDSADFDGDRRASTAARSWSAGSASRAGAATAPGRIRASGSDESGEVFVEPLSQPGSRASAWSVASRSRSAASASVRLASSAPSVAAGAVGSDEAGAARAVPDPGRAGPGAARHGLSRLRCDARSRRGAEGAAPGGAPDGQGAGAVPGRGPGAGAAAASADRPGLRGGPRRRSALHRHGADRGPQPGRTAGRRARCRPATPRRSSPSWPRPWPMPTPWGSCTGTSSRPTSGSTTAATST